MPNERKILILGAGASVRAGYPPSYELLPRMGEEASTSSFSNFTSAWRGWQEYLEQLPSELNILRDAKNPELILSLTDLLDTTAEQEDDRRAVEAIQEALRTGEADPTPLEDYYASGSRDLLGIAKEGKRHLTEALTWYFTFRHYKDTKASRSTRNYLRNLLSRLKLRDTVLTFNWDALVEHTLVEDGRWTPRDGYGFSRSFERHISILNHQAIPDDLFPPSDFLVLKLHGSFGWRKHKEDIYLDSENFLSLLPWQNPEDLLPLHDAAQPDTYTPTDPVVAYPSYLKQFTHPVLENTWRMASAVLENASYVEVIGYSLPSSDSAARALFLPLARRCRTGEVHVVICDPSRHVLERWTAFLGTNAETRQEAL